MTKSATGMVKVYNIKVKNLFKAVRCDHKVSLIIDMINYNRYDKFIQHKCHFVSYSA